MKKPEIIPISNHIDDGITIYDYNKDEYEKWQHRGEEFGDSGIIIIAEDEKFIIFEGYGTKEKPITKRIRIKAEKTYG